MSRYTNEGVAQAFARGCDEGHNGRGSFHIGMSKYSFRGEIKSYRAVYSYSQPIAIHLKDTEYVVCNHYWSSATDRHQARVLYALPLHVKIWRLPKLDPDNVSRDTVELMEIACKMKYIHNTRASAIADKLIEAEEVSERFGLDSVYSSIDGSTVTQKLLNCLPGNFRDKITKALVIQELTK